MNYVYDWAIYKLTFDLSIIFSKKIISLNISQLMYVHDHQFDSVSFIIMTNFTIQKFFGLRFKEVAREGHGTKHTTHVAHTNLYRSKFWPMCSHALCSFRHDWSIIRPCINFLVYTYTLSELCPGIAYKGVYIWYTLC